MLTKLIVTLSIKMLEKKVNVSPLLHDCRDVLCWSCSYALHCLQIAVYHMTTLVKAVSGRNESAVKNMFAQTSRAATVVLSSVIIILFSRHLPCISQVAHIMSLLCIDDFGTDAIAT